MWDHMQGWGGGWMGLGWLWMVLFWVVLTLAIVALVRWITASSPRPEAERKAPLDILEERYARGEIDRDEFEQKKRDLGG